MMGDGRSRLIVGISGATGAILGVRLLQVLQSSEVETHLVFSKWGVRTLPHETPYSLEQVQQMATHHYASQDEGAAISSGSFLTRGMVVCPCSVRSVAAIANGHGDNLIHRAADMGVKERRKLLLAVREAPLNDLHRENSRQLPRRAVGTVRPVHSNQDSQIQSLECYQLHYPGAAASSLAESSPAAQQPSVQPRAACNAPASSTA